LYNEKLSTAVESVDQVLVELRRLVTDRQFDVNSKFWVTEPHGSAKLTVAAMARADCSVPAQLSGGLVRALVAAHRLADDAAEAGKTQRTIVIEPAASWIFAFTLDNAKSEAKTCHQKERIFEKMKITVAVCGVVS